MDFLKKLGLVEDDKKPVAKPAPVTKAVTPVSIPAGTGTTLAAQGVLDVPTITADIEHDIRGSGAYAVFNKFEEQLEKLKNVPGMDEPTKFRTVQAIIEATPEELITAVESHGIVLAQAAQRFEAEFVTASKDDLEKTKAQVDVAEQKIQQLTQELSTATQDKMTLVTSVQQKTVDLSKADIDFKSIVTNLSTKYSDISKKVQMYLGATNAK